MIVHYSGSNVLTGTGKSLQSEFLFLPGNNDVPSETWKDLMGNPNFARRVKEGKLKVRSENDTAEDENALAEMGPADAKQMVRETYDPELLRRWKSVESRKTVVAVIDEQLEAADKRMAERSKKSNKDDDGE